MAKLQHDNDDNSSKDAVVLLGPRDLNMKVSALAFEACGYDVVRLECGGTGYCAADDSRGDIVLINMDGCRICEFGSCRHLMEARARHTPIIGLVESEQACNLSSRWGAIADCYLFKPVSIGTLISATDALRTVMPRSRAMPGGASHAPHLSSHQVRSTQISQT